MSRSLVMEPLVQEGPIPPELGNLGALKILSMWNNQLDGAIPGALGSLKNLTWLDLSNNELCGPIPPQLGNLWSLKHLNLSSNPLSGGEIPKRLAEHPRFKKFIVGRAMDGPPLPHINDTGHAVKILIVPVALGYLDLTSDLYTPTTIQATYFEFTCGRRFLVATQLSLLLEAVFSAASRTYSPVLALVRVIEPLFESVPQLLLQLYAMLLLWSETSLSNSDLNGRVISVCISTVSLAYAATDVSSVERLLNTRLSGEGGTERSRMCPDCPFITGLVFSRVPEKGVSRLAGRMGWVHPRTHVWFCFLYHVLEIVSRFVPLTMIALVLRKWFFLVLPYLWISRCLVVWAAAYWGEATMGFRFRVRIVAMPFIDSILDGTRAFGAGLVLTLVKFVACIVTYHLFSSGHLPPHARWTLTIIAICCMVGKMRLALLAILPLKANEHGFQSQGAAAAQGDDDVPGGGTDEHSTGTRVIGLDGRAVDVDELETAECGTPACSEETPSQPITSAMTISASERGDVKVVASPPASIPPASSAPASSTEQLPSHTMAKAPIVIAGAVGVALGAGGEIRGVERHRNQEGVRPEAGSRAALPTGLDSARSSPGVVRPSPDTSIFLASPRATMSQGGFFAQQQQEEGQQDHHNPDADTGRFRLVGEGAHPLAHAAEHLPPDDAVLAHQAAAYPSASSMLPAASAMPNSLGTVQLRHGFVQPCSAAAAATGDPQPPGNMSATQQAWHAAGVMGMPSYPQGMLPLRVGDGAGVFQHMGFTGEGWPGYLLAPQYSSHGVIQAGYTLPDWAPPWYGATDMDSYATGQPWLSRMQLHATAPAASIGEQLAWRRAYHEESALSEDYGWWDEKYLTGVTTTPAADGSGVVREWQETWES
ncbi:unnamed protein product [Ectocarpus sp. CCAP 1310/34]|nr:unnamed protein product [Ectocarpus sp. CCAP 1310/34]